MASRHTVARRNKSVILGKSVKATAAPYQLRTDHLVAKFDNAGRLFHLSANGRGKGTVTATICRYSNQIDKQVFTDQPSGEDLPSRGASSINHNAFEVERLHATETSLHVTKVSPHLRISIVYQIAAHGRLLEINIRSQGTGKEGKAIFPATPHYVLADDFNDIYEDPKDLFCDGAEVDFGSEIPAWRVFFKKGYKSGVIVAARSKQDMGHLDYKSNAFEVRPHVLSNYDTAAPIYPKLLDTSSRKWYETKIEVGPWSAATHDDILSDASLRKPGPAHHGKSSGKPKPTLKGVVLHAKDVAKPKQAGANFKWDRWLIADAAWSASGKALVANTGVIPPAILFKPKLKGLHRVIVGIGSGPGVTFGISDHSEKEYRLRSGKAELTAFSPVLWGKHIPGEVDCGVHEMKGKAFEVGRFPERHQPSFIDYVRFEPLSDAQAKKWLAKEQGEPVLELSGLNDTPDIAVFTDSQEPDPQAYYDNLVAHAKTRVRKVFWRIDGQCSDFPSKHNTQRYVSAKVHGVFNPRAKAYGKVLNRVNMLELAVAAAGKNDLSLYGWMRFNNYGGNVQSDFYKNNTEFWEEWDHGYRGTKLCLGFPEVRKHKIDILVEAAGYGLQGLCLGFLRHPPILLYHPILVDSYEKKFGRKPPRDPEHKDPRHARSLPIRRNQNEWNNWWAHRANYMTQFGRELKAALAKKKLRHVKIAIWVRPNHCLFDGIDLPAWLEEGLCDEVVSAAYQPIDDRKVYDDTPAWRKMVRKHVPLARMINTDIKRAKPEVKQIVESGEYDGICTYESDYTCLDSDYIELYRSLRK